MKHRVSELEGALLDAAVAECGEWKTAHGHFPAMTLDPTFKGWRLIRLRNELVCLLEPNNPMRQDPQQYSPSADWGIGGPIIERERIELFYGVGRWHALCPQETPEPGCVVMSGPAEHYTGQTALVAAMRAFVGAKLAGFGETVELPEAPE